MWPGLHPRPGVTHAPQTRLLRWGCWCWSGCVCREGPVHTRHPREPRRLSQTKRQSQEQTPTPHSCAHNLQTHSRHTTLNTCVQTPDNKADTGHTWTCTHTPTRNPRHNTHTRHAPTGAYIYGSTNSPKSDTRADAQMDTQGHTTSHTDTHSRIPSVQPAHAPTSTVGSLSPFSPPGVLMPHKALLGRGPARRLLTHLLACPPRLQQATLQFIS